MRAASRPTAIAHKKTARGFHGPPAVPEMLCDLLACTPPSAAREPGRVAVIAGVESGAQMHTS